MQRNDRTGGRFGSRVRAALVFLSWGAAAGALAAETDSRLDAALLAGYDSNPARLASSLEEGGSFLEARLDARLEIVPGPRGRYRLAARGVTRRHEGRLDVADLSLAEVEAQALFTPWLRRGRHLSIGVGGRASGFRSTFLDPETGEVYRVPVDPADPVSPEVEIGDRLDFDAVAATLDLDWRFHEKARLSLGATRENLRYAPPAGAGWLDPLDHAETEIAATVTFRPLRAAELAAGWGWSRRDYDLLRAVDGTGRPVDGTTRSYRRGGPRLTVRVDLPRRVDLEVGARSGSREDLGAGYYDADERSYWIAAGTVLGEKNRVALTALFSSLDYPNATIGSDPNGERRGYDARRLTARFERPLAGGVSLFAEAGTQDSENRDPIYAYARRFALAGARYRR